jgi:DNA-binding FadR family transcriptional regulator
MRIRRSDPATPMGFTPVRHSRASTEIATRIREAIFKGEYLPGQRLPAEREMARRFASSRGTVRDALRALETAGLIEVRVGATGGAFVSEPDATWLTETLETHVQARGTSFQELAEARLGLELIASRLAVERATAAELDSMRRLLGDPSPQPPDTAGGLLDFHHLVVEAAHNPFLLEVWTACRRLIQEPFDVLEALQPAMADAATDAHRRFFAALVQREADLAVRLMREHLSDFADRAERAFEESRRRKWQAGPQVGQPVSRPGG